MGYSNKLILLFLIIKPWESSSITTRIDHHQPVRNFRRHTAPAPAFTDWELGLREAVHQALLREHHTEPTLRDQLLEAPLIGRRNNASPFGDIAVLGRGQLYVTSEGFKFVQDSDQDDCVDCHDARCARSPQCQLWKTVGHHYKLLALWTVKRIRHRDPHFGHVFEIEYTISPITSAVSEELVRSRGYFNYNIPGHIFVVRSDPRLNYYDDKWYKSEAPQTQDYRDHGHFKPGILIGVTPDGYKHVLHSFPGFYSSYHNDQTTIDPKEYELYKKLIESLAAKTSNVPHRFSVTTPAEKPATTTPTYLTTLIPQTTYVRVVPTHLVTPGTTQVTKYSQPDLYYHTLPTTTPKRVTTIHYYTPVEVPNRTTATTPQKVIPTTSKSTFEDIDFDLFGSTPVKKSTLKKTTPVETTQPERFNLFPDTSTEPMQRVTESPKKTSPDSVNEQLPPPEENVETTVPYVSSTVTQPSTTQRLTTVFVPSTTVIEKVPGERTTVVLPVPTQHQSTTPLGRISTVTDKIYTGRSTVPTTVTDRGTTLVETVPARIYTVTPASTAKTTPLQKDTTLVETVPAKIYTIEAAVPTEATSTQKGTTLVETIPSKVYTLPVTIPVRSTTTGPSTSTIPVRFTTTGPSTIPVKSTTTGPSTILSTLPGSTIYDRGTTQGFTITETIPATRFVPTTQKTITSTKPTTIFEYSFDSTTKSLAETVQSTINTLPATTNQFPSTEPIRFTIPTTTSHYYYTFETEGSKAPTVTEEGTTSSRSTQSETPSIIKQSTSREEDIFPIEAATEKTTQRTKAPVSSTTQDFLVDLDDEKRNKITDSKKDFNEDDIFGKPVVRSTQEPEITTKPVVQSDIANALFGGRAQRIKVSSKITRRPVINSTRIIYGNFYAPSTENPTSSFDTTAYESTTEFRPSTDQSYSTSISFEVNKRNRTRPTPPIRANLSGTGRYKKYKTDKMELKKTDEKNETKKVFDDLALQVVHHARSIDYLQQKPSRQPKYRRRSFATRRKTPRRSSKSEKKSN